MDEAKHFAIGLTVDVKDGALPAGWDKHGMMDDPPAPPKNEQITAVENGNASEPMGTFEVGGWWWYPQDIEIRSW